MPALQPVPMRFEEVLGPGSKESRRQRRKGLSSSEPGMKSHPHNCVLNPGHGCRGGWILLQTPSDQAMQHSPSPTVSDHRWKAGFWGLSPSVLFQRGTRLALNFHGRSALSILMFLRLEGFLGFTVWGHPLFQPRGLSSMDQMCMPIPCQDNPNT